MGRKVWTAAELEQMMPAQQDEVFETSVVTDLDEVPAEFLGRIRCRLEQRIASGQRPEPQ